MRECQDRFGFSKGGWDSAVTRGDIVPRRDRPQSPVGERRNAVAELAAEGMSRSAIAAALGISRPTVSYHAQRLGLQESPAFSKRYDWTAIQEAYDSGKSLRECQMQFGFSSASWHAAVHRGAITARPCAAPIETYLVAGRQTSRNHLKRRLIKEGFKRMECEQCDLTNWGGRRLSFELHHVNGVRDDNRLGNLLLLCPNCHSQTHSWGGRNRGRAAA